MTTNHFLSLVSSLALAAVIFALAWTGWRNRRRRQSDVPRPAPVPAEIDGRVSSFACPVQYVSTTTAGDWLDRIAAHGLGMKSNGQALVFEDGLVIARDGADDLWIPRDGITALRRESGMAGKFVEKNGLAVITWLLGDVAVDTGLRARYAQDTPALLAALHDMAPGAESGLPASTPRK